MTIFKYLIVIENCLGMNTREVNECTQVAEMNDSRLPYARLYNKIPVYYV